MDLTHIACCGQCYVFPCESMAKFYGESEGHRAAYMRMQTMGTRKD